MFLRQLLLVAAAAAFAPVHRPQTRTLTARAAEELVLCEENVEAVLADARNDMQAVFGYAEDSRRVGITGTVDFVELDGPTVVLRLGGRFWHQRSDVLQRVGNFLTDRIPEICDVAIEDAEQLDDADKLAEKTNW
mmetsp:Transcript_28969/g.86487  ORF Transcript_28969/g.86487 Transcript_28969/m.86487 type:complete len:135 (+) Transcript_28969:96-500(+)